MESLIFLSLSVKLVEDWKQNSKISTTFFHPEWFSVELNYVFQKCVSVVFSDELELCMPI